MKVNIGEILSKSWKIIWKFKVLWLFGILAGCSTSSGNRFNYNTNSSDWNSSTRQMPDYFQRFFNMQPGHMFQSFFQQYTALIAVMIVLMCVLWLVFFFLGFVGKTGLIKGAAQADGGAESLKFGPLWKESMPYFWKIAGLNLMITLPVTILIIILLTGMAVAGYFSFKDGSPSMGMGALLVVAMGFFVMVLCVIGIISFILNMILDQAQNALILENKGIIEAWVRGWNIFKSAWVTFVVLAIIMAIIGGVAGLIMSIPLVTIMIPAGIGLAINKGKDIFVPIAIAAGMFILYMPVLMVLSGILQSYSQTVWTLTFLRLTAPKTQAE